MIKLKDLLKEDKFIAFYKNDRVTVTAKSLWDAKKQIIAKLKVPKKDVGLVSVLNKTEYDKQKFRFEGKLQEKAKRDYKAEYKKFQSSTKSKKYRAELNKYNRQKGTYGNGDGKDASHKGGKIAGFEKESVNRGRREKSRLKKEIKLTDLVPKTIKEAQEPLWDKDSVKNVIKQIQKGIKVPYADGLGLGALSRRDEHPTIIGKISVDKKKDWPNGYIENSRWALVTIYPNGVVDTVRMNGYGDFKTRKKVPVLRKSKNKSIKQIIDRLGKYFTVVRLKHPDNKGK